jgi:hypothetical protein
MKTKNKKPLKPKSTVGYAVVVAHAKGFPRSLCYTSGPFGGTVWQIYRTKKEAIEFCSLPFGDASYIIQKIIISEIP